jgi:hypothetical protein
MSRYPSIASALFLGILLPMLACGQAPSADDAAFEVEGFEEGADDPDFAVEGFEESSADADFEVEGFDEGADDAGFAAEGFEEVPGFAEGEFPEIEIKTDPEALAPPEDQAISFSGKLQARLDVSPREPDQSFGFNRKSAGVAQISSNLKLFLKAAIDDRVEAKLGLHAEATELYNVRHNPPLYPSNVRDKDIRRIEPDETYLDLRPTNRLWLRLGNQINIWGTSDNYRVVDVLNPRDQRLFEQEGPEETRLPNWASRISYTLGSWSADLIGIYHFRGDRIGRAGADFDPFILFRTASTTVSRDEGPDGYDPEWAVRLSRRFHAADVSLYFGDVYNKVAVAKFADFDFRTGQLKFEPDYDRMSFVGVSGSFVHGSWLYKTDMAYKHDLSFLRADFFPTFNPFAPTSNLITEDTLEGMWGVEYNGLPNSSVSLEVVGRRILDYDSRLLDEQNTFGGVLTFMNDAFKDTLHSEIRGIQLFNGAGYILNAKVEYDLTDDLDLTVIYTDYISTDKNGFLYPYRDNDRLLMGVTYRY